MGDLESKDLSDFFKVIKTGKKENRIQKDNLVGASFEELFWSKLSETKTNSKSKKKELKEDVISEKKDVTSSLEPNYVEPVSVKNKDPLTPLNQKFITIDDFNRHYNLFLSRIQQQLSTLGGGGETNLTYMDVPVTSVTTSTYTVKLKDYYVGINYAGAVTITLPKADRQGKIFVIKDELGEASRGNNRHITIIPTGNDLIDGRSRAILSYDYGSLTFIWKGNSWRVI